MNKTTIKNNRLTLFSFCIIFLFSSCVNELDSETSPDTVPGTIHDKSQQSRHTCD